MATQQLPQHVVPPASLVTTVALPSAPLGAAVAPVPGTTVLRTEVPVIDPYLVAGFSGAGVLAVSVDGARAVASPNLCGAGVLTAYQRWAVQQPFAGIGTGAMTARVAIVSGPPMVGAPLTGLGHLSGTVDLRPGAVGSSEGAVTVALRVVASAEAILRGEGRYSGLIPELAEGGGQGALTSEVTAAGAVVVAADLRGSAATTAPTGSVAQVSGSGDLSTRMGSPAGFGAVGELGYAQTPRASVSSDHTGSGALAAAVTMSFLPSSMKKNATSFSSLDQTWKTIPGWLADTTGYPGSSVSGDGLVVQGAKTDATVTASVPFTPVVFSSAGITLRLMIDGAVAVTGTKQTVPANTPTTVTVSGTAAVAADDVITVQVTSDNSITNPTIAANAAAYVRVT